MGPCSLVKKVAERLVDDVAFDGGLKEAATFRPPQGPTETGLYELREEAYEEVNPFFYDYTRNRRAEGTLLRNRIKKTRKKEWEIVLEPKGFALKDGP